MKLLFFTVAVVIAITILSTDALFNRRVNRHQRFRHSSSSSSSSSSTKWVNGPRHNTRRVNRPRHNIRNQCLHLCESSLLKEKLMDEICPDPCEGITCSTNGVCERGRCNCFSGYTGCDCESEIDTCRNVNEIDPCRNVNCKNNGQCEEGNCTCVDGFGGQFCEEVPNMPPSIVGPIEDQTVSVSDTGEIIQLQANDPNGDPIKFQVQSWEPTTGADLFTLNPNGTVSVTDGANLVVGTYILEFVAVDDRLLPSTTATLSITVVDLCVGVNCNEAMEGGTCENGLCMCNDRFTGVSCTDCSPPCSSNFPICTRDGCIRGPPIE